MCGENANRESLYRSHLSLNQGFDHSLGGYAVNVTDHTPKLDPAVVQKLVQPILLSSHLAGKLQKITGNKPQLAKVLGRDETWVQQTTTGQLRQPLVALYISFAPRNLLHIPSIHQINPWDLLLQDLVNRFPENTRALYHHQLNPSCQEPSPKLHSYSRAEMTTRIG
jgi:hypothetical protein